MTRDELEDCEIGTMFICNEEVFLVVDKDRWMLKLQQLVYEIDDGEFCDTYKTVWEFESGLDECNDRLKFDDNYTFDISLNDYGMEFYQHYKDIEDPDFDVPYEDTY